METIQLSFAELHTPLFMGGAAGGGVNMGTKLSTINKRGLILVYDREMKELFVGYNGSIAIVPMTNVAAMVPLDPEQLSGYNLTTQRTGTVAAIKAVIPEAVTDMKRGPGRPKAQVSTPTSHVFETK